MEEETEKKGKGPTVSARLLQFALEKLLLWKSPWGEPYCTIKETHKNLPINSPVLSNLLTKWFVTMTDGNDVASPNIVKAVLAVLTSEAQLGNKTYEPAIRTSFDGETLWVDLGDSRYAYITAEGWSIRNSTHIKFIDVPGGLPFPDPDPNGDINDLKDFVLTTDEDHFKLIVGWLVGSYLCPNQYPILQVGGAFGASKSTLSSFLRGLTDPSSKDLEGVPEGKRDLIAQVRNTHVAAFDNISYMPQWLSNTFCQLSTGITLSSRTLYSQSEVDAVPTSKPLILNGIEQFSEAPDLLSRILYVHLPIFDRESEALAQKSLVIKEMYKRAQPALIGGLFNTLSHILKNHHTVYLKKAPRLIKLALYMTAAEEFLGWPKGTWLQVAMNNADEQFSEAVTNNPVAGVLIEYMREEKAFEGTLSDLMAALSMKAPRNNPKWPRTAAKMRNEIHKIENELNKCNIVMRKSNRSASGQRYILELKE